MSGLGFTLNPLGHWAYLQESPTMTRKENIVQASCAYVKLHSISSSKVK